MAEFNPNSPYPGEMRIGMDVEGRKTELGQKGIELTQAVVVNLPTLEANRVLVKRLSPSDQARGQQRYVAGSSSISGGWREIGPSQAMRLEVLRPIDTGAADQSGFVGVEFSRTEVRDGKTEAVSRPDRIRIDFDPDGVPHILGTRKGIPFNVDHANPRSLYADLRIATTLLRKAMDGLTRLSTDT